MSKTPKNAKRTQLDEQRISRAEIKRARKALFRLMIAQ